jgi:hypothetical protein
LNWKRKFEAEMRALKEKARPNLTREEEEKAAKLTGKAWFV